MRGNKELPDAERQANKMQTEASSPTSCTERKNRRGGGESDEYQRYSGRILH